MSMGTKASVYEVRAGRLITRHGTPFVTITKKNGVDPVEADRFTRRVAACLNACVGIPIEALEAGALRTLIDDAGDGWGHPSTEAHAALASLKEGSHEPG